MCILQRLHRQIAHGNIRPILGIPAVRAHVIKST